MGHPYVGVDYRCMGCINKTPLSGFIGVGPEGNSKMEGKGREWNIVE